MSEPENAFDSVAEAIDAIAAGDIVIVTDDESRENEGDLIMAASMATPEKINMMIRHARGLICAPTTEYQLRRLGINPMVANNRENHRTDFTVSVDAYEGITTGISAADRCATIRILGDPESTADQLVQPGHIFPLRAKPGGVLQRAGHTEAAVDLTVLAGHPPTAVICEILNEDGTMSRLAELIEFKKQHNVKMISIKQLIEYRHSRECLVERISTRPFINAHGKFELHAFRSILDDRVHFALTYGDLTDKPVLVRVQAENVLHDVFAGSIAGESSESFHLPHERPVDLALKRIVAEGCGAFVYMTQPCAGADIPGLTAKTAGGCQLEATGMHLRGYGLGAQILTALGLRKIRLLSSSQRRPVALDGYGLEIVETVAL